MKKLPAVDSLDTRNAFIYKKKSDNNKKKRNTTNKI